MRDEEGKQYSIKISLKYVPVKMQLDPSESINNMGNLRVTVLDAKNLPAADSNGKSDPYVKFELNDQDVYKTKIQKKNLNPTWNESFDVPVPSRTAAKFIATVWDYDFADKPDKLGAAVINLDVLEPFKAKEMVYTLDGKSGSLRLNFVFRPDYVTRTRQGSSTFSGTFSVPGKIVTGVAGVPLKGGAAVAHGVGKGASFLKNGLLGRNKKDDDSGSDGIPTITTNSPEPSAGMGLKRSAVLTMGDGDARPGSPPSNMTAGTANGGLNNHSRHRSIGASSVHSAIMPGAASGTASFTVLSSSGFPPSADVYVSITQMKDGKSKLVGKTKYHKSSSGTVRFDETFKISCTPDSTFKIEAKEHHTLSSDELLGEGAYYVDESNSGQEKEIRAGSGVVLMKSYFQPTSTPTESLSSEPPRSPHSRRSFLGKRELRTPSRDS